LNDEEITVPNRDQAMQKAIQEMMRLSLQLNDGNAPRPTIREAKEIFKELGIKPKHLEREL
jgi:hypothetical protein